MKFLVLLLTFILQRKLNLTLSRQHDHWARSFLAYFEKLLPVIRNNALLYILIAMVLPCAALLLVMGVAEGQLYGMLTLFIHITMLFLCLGCGYIREALDRYLQFWAAGNYQSAFQTLESAEIYIDDADRMTPAEIHYQACTHYMYQTFQRYFMVIFWYMVAGPVGALLARLAYVPAFEPTLYMPERVRVVYRVLEWFPARFLALTFALVGNFSGVLKSAGSRLLEPGSEAMLLLKLSAAGALESFPAQAVAGPAETHRDSRQLLALRDLLNRSMLIWFSLIAVLTIAGLMT